MQHVASERSSLSITTTYSLTTHYLRLTSCVLVNLASVETAAQHSRHASLRLRPAVSSVFYVRCFSPRHIAHRICRRGVCAFQSPRHILRYSPLLFRTPLTPTHPTFDQVSPMSLSLEIDARNGGVVCNSDLCAGSGIFAAGDDLS